MQHFSKLPFKKLLFFQTSSFSFQTTPYCQITELLSFSSFIKKNFFFYKQLSFFFLGVNGFILFKQLQFLSFSTLFSNSLFLFKQFLSFQKVSLTFFFLIKHFLSLFSLFSNSFFHFRLPFQSASSFFSSSKPVRAIFSLSSGRPSRKKTNKKNCIFVLKENR